MADKPTPPPIVPKTGTANQSAPVSTPSSPTDIDSFLTAARNMAPAAAGSGRLIFALDATMSRQPTWDAACQVQAEMFTQAGRIGGLAIQLVYFRGFNECRASRWVSDDHGLANLMTGIMVRGGHTQIRKVLKHALNESDRGKVGALVYIGDCVEEPVDDLCDLAGQLGLRGIPAFMFQEGGEPIARAAFQEIARLTGGAYCPFDTGSADQLRDLLSAVAVYAAGGHKALSDFSGRAGDAAIRLIGQMKR